MRNRLAAGVIALATALWASTAQAHEFLVYFRFNSAEFMGAKPGPGAAWYRAVVKDAACFGRMKGVTKVVVTARADRSGPAEYNLALSRRRAEAVAAMLVRDGVDPAKIEVDAKGETQPSVITADGVPEPLNRVAVIDHRGEVTGAPGDPVCDGSTLPKPPSMPQ